MILTPLSRVPLSVGGGVRGATGAHGKRESSVLWRIVAYCVVAYCVVLWRGVLWRGVAWCGLWGGVVCFFNVAMLSVMISYQYFL